MQRGRADIQPARLQEVAARHPASGAAQAAHDGRCQGYPGTRHECRNSPPHSPGEILLEEFMQPLGISQNRLGRDLGVPPQRTCDIIHGRWAITTDTALRLGVNSASAPSSGLISRRATTCARPTPRAWPTVSSVTCGLSPSTPDHRSPSPTEKADNDAPAPLPALTPARAAISRTSAVPALHPCRRGPCRPHGRGCSSLCSRATRHG